MLCNTLKYNSHCKEKFSGLFLPLGIFLGTISPECHTNICVQILMGRAYSQAYPSAAAANHVPVDLGERGLSLG